MFSSGLLQANNDDDDDRDKKPHRVYARGGMKKEQSGCAVPDHSLENACNTRWKTGNLTKLPQATHVCPST